MPLPSLEELLSRARAELDTEYDALSREVRHIVEDLKRRRLAEIDELVNRFVEELKRVGSS